MPEARDERSVRGKTLLVVRRQRRKLLLTSNMPADVNTCCCWKRVKSGSYTCGLYTLILYTALFVAGLCHAQTVVNAPSMLVFCLVMVVLSATCILCSIILIIGLWKNNRYLLLPWTVAVSMTTLIDVMVSFYLIRDAITEPFLAVLFVTDVLICAVNVYALLCVLSQYQEYKIGQVRQNVAQPRDQEIVREQPPRPPITSSVTEDVTSSNTQLLPSGSPKKVHASATPGGKLVYCELTTISEEMHSPLPATPKDLSTMKFIESLSEETSGKNELLATEI